MFLEKKEGEWQEPGMIAKTHSGSEAGCKLKSSGGRIGKAKYYIHKKSKHPIFQYQPVVPS